LQVRRLPESPHGRTAKRRGTPSRKRVGPMGLGGSTPSPSARSDRAPQAARRASPQGARRDARTEAWPSWQGSALLARRRRHAARRFESCCLRFTMRRRPIGRTTGCYPEDAGSSPAVAAHMPRSSSGSRMPASQAGDAGSNPARGAAPSPLSSRASKSVDPRLHSIDPCIEGRGRRPALPAGRPAKPGSVR
jgi:hypothetical protein